MARRMFGLVSGIGMDFERCSRGFSDPTAAAAIARLDRPRPRRPLRSEPARRRPVSEFGRALARALGMEVEEG